MKGLILSMLLMVGLCLETITLADEAIDSDNKPFAEANIVLQLGDGDADTQARIINVANNPRLNHTAKTPAGWGYAVFGKVVEGKDVVDKIKAVPTTTKGMYQNVPQPPVPIITAIIVSQ